MENRNSEDFEIKKEAVVFGKDLSIILQTCLGLCGDCERIDRVERRPLAEAAFTAHAAEEHLPSTFEECELGFLVGLEIFDLDLRVAAAPYDCLGDDVSFATVTDRNCCTQFGNLCFWHSEPLSQDFS